MLSFSAIEQARQRLSGVAHRTPLITSRALNALCDRQVWLKAENLQHTGAFKIRGAYNALAAALEQGRVGRVVTYSSGNHGQAIARSAQLLNVDATIVMPNDAPEVKKAAVRHYGATIVTYDRFAEDRAAVAAAIASETGAIIIPPFDHLDVMAGQGTCGLELIEDAPPLDAIAVCLGGGGLLSGIATAANHLSPTTQVIGVEPATGDDGAQSLRAGRLITIYQPVTIADGQATTALGAHTFEVIADKVPAIVTVTDRDIVEAMRFCFDRLRLVVEPSGASALAAVMTGKIGTPGQRVAATLSGGNVDRARFAELIINGVE